MPSLIVRSERVVFPDGTRPASVLIEDGRITRIGEQGAAAPAHAEALDAGSLVVLPGLVDTHVHINDPGRAEWEGFEHATRAAAAGGVTTLVDMPLNSIPATTRVDGLREKRAAASGRCYVDVGFWGGVVPGNQSELAALSEAGVLGFKCFLSPSGVEEFAHVDERDLRIAVPLLASLGRPLLAHAELPALLVEPRPGADPRVHDTWVATRPAASEHAAIELLIELSGAFDAHVHVVHLAAASALSMLRQARKAGVRITVETCPHYLTFAAEDVPTGATAFKCAPPLRSRPNSDALWQGLLEGDIDLIATDHSPSPPTMKSTEAGDFLRAWGGIASLQVGLAAIWTGARERHATFDDLARWMSAAPARLAGLSRTKGAIAVGYDADLVIWDPDEEFVVDPADLYHRHRLTPYAGRALRGRVKKTVLGGKVVFDGRIVGGPHGKLL